MLGSDFGGAPVYSYSPAVGIVWLYTMREIVTLQLGHLSNYVATHFWNAQVTTTTTLLAARKHHDPRLTDQQESYFTYSNQEESPIDHNVHWRPGIGADGSETFLPRTIVYDLKGGFGALRKTNALYEPQSESGHLEAAPSLW